MANLNNTTTATSSKMKHSPLDVAQRLAAEAINSAATAASFANDSISPVLEALSILADFDSMELGAMRLRMLKIKGLARLGVHLSDEMASHFENEHQEAIDGLDALKAGAA